VLASGGAWGGPRGRGLAAAYAGTGSTEELAAAHVAGKAVIVTNDPAADPPARTQAAADAGAKLEIVVNDQPGKLSQWVGTDTGYSAIPVASVTRAVGTPLIARALGGKLHLKLLWQPQSPFMYDLIDVHPGAIPSNLTYRPGRDLARVDTHYNADHPVDGSDFRWDLRPYTFGAIGFSERNAFPATRVDWVSTPPGTQWHEQAWLEPQIMEQRSGLITYKPGSKQQVTWFAPVQRARLGTGAWQPERFDFGLSINVTPWTDNGTDHAGFVDDGSEQVELRILQGSTVLADGPFQATWASLPDNGTHRYTVDLDASRDPAEWRLTTSNHTVWRVVSGPPDPAVGQYLLPMLQLDYGVRTDVAGNADPGRQTITLGASHMPGVVGGGKVTGGWLRVSYDDGRHWIPVPLSGAPGHWTASFSPPAGARFVSLRAYATDDRGNTVTQEVIRAYSLK